MKQKRGKILLFTVLCGVVGGIMRIMEWGTALNEGVGLAEEYHPISIAMMIFSIMMIVGALLISSKICKKGLDSRLNKGKAGKIVQTIGAALIIIASAMFLVGYMQVRIILLVVMFLVGILSGVGIIAMNKKTDEPSDNKLWSIIPPIFCCAWTLLEYKVYATEPQIIKFAYFCLADVFITLAFYFISGYYYDRKEPKWTAFSIILGVFFSLIVILEDPSLYVLIMRLGFILTVAPELTGLLNSVGETPVEPVEELAEAPDDLPDTPLQEEEQDSEENDEE